MEFSSALCNSYGNAGVTYALAVVTDLKDRSQCNVHAVLNNFAYPNLKLFLVNISHVYQLLSHNYLN